MIFVIRKLGQIMIEEKPRDKKYFLWNRLIHLFLMGHSKIIKGSISFVRCYTPWVVIWVTCLIRSRNCLPFASTWVHPRSFGGVRVAHLLILCCTIMCLHVRCSMLWCPLRFPHKTMFCSSLPPVVCMRVHVLFTLFVFICIQWCPTHIVLWFFSVLCTLCCQFLWIVPFDCPYGIL
jgi:hypothetical protein